MVDLLFIVSIISEYKKNGSFYDIIYTNNRSFVETSKRKKEDKNGMGCYYKRFTSGYHG